MVRTGFIQDTSLTVAAEENILLSRLVGSVHKFGENEASTAGARLPIWSQGTAYPYPTTAVITHVKQEIDQAAMRGQTVEVQGLDASWNLVVQNVTLDATLTTNLVALTTPLLRIFRMKVLANVVTAQHIVTTEGTGTTVYSEIPIGYNQTLMALYTVPAGVTAYITKYFADVLEDPVATKDPDASEFILWFADRANNYEFQVKHERGIVKGAPGFDYKFDPYMKVTEKTDIMLTSECSGKTGHVHAGFCLILVRN